MSNEMPQPPSERTTCRIAGDSLIPLFSLGELYISDFLKPDASPTYPPIELKLCLSRKSGLVQLAHSAPPEEMYRQYWYRSGTNATMTNELRGIAEAMQRLVQFSPGDVFIDIGCNDGTLLSFMNPSITRIGYDPAKNNYKEVAEKHANLIINDYFTAAAFKQTSFGNQKAKGVTSIAMFYDLEDPHAFVQDIYDILDDNGLWILQMSYLPLMLEQLAFDNICHEHLEYYDLHTLKKLLEAHAFEVVDCELNDINGGSYRVYIRKTNADPTRFATAPQRDVARMRVNSLLAYEKTLHLDQPETYIAFFQKISALKEQTVTFIKEEKAKGKSIWAYGASTKGNTLLQWFGLDHTLIDGIAERAPTKFGLKTVGTNIPIFSEDEMRAQKPDYLLVLPWHFIAEFRRREDAYLRAGGRFIVPCPRFEVLGPID